MQQAPFVGSSRQLLVDGLVAVYDEVVQDKCARWISLEASTGLGKTRIVTEFYAQLAATRQDEPRYWPSSIPGSQNEGSPQRSDPRKAVNPLVAAHVSGSVPGWGWWGITCGLRKAGGAAESLALDARVLQDHALYYDLAMGSSGGWKAFARELTGQLGAELVDQGVEGLVTAVASEFVPGVGTAKWLLQRAWSAGAQKINERRTLIGADAVHIGAQGAPGVVDDLTALLGALGRNGVPMVIVVEDIHEASSSLAALLQKLMTSKTAVLVVSTGWPGFLEENKPVWQAMHHPETSLTQVRFGDESSLPAPFPAGSGLVALSNEAATTIAKHYWPGIDDHTARQIAGRYANPLALKLLHEIVRYRTRPQLVVADFSRLPRDIDALYRVVWTNLPEDIRRHLVVATLGIPSRLGADDTLPTTWNVDLIMSAAEAAGVGPLADFASNSDFAWSAVAGDGLRGFVERAQLDVAAGDDDFFGPDSDDPDKVHFWLTLCAQVMIALDAADHAAGHGTLSRTTRRARPGPVSWRGWAGRSSRAARPTTSPCSLVARTFSSPPIPAEPTGP